MLSMTSSASASLTDTSIEARYLYRNLMCNASYLEVRVVQLLGIKKRSVRGDQS